MERNYVSKAAALLLVVCMTFVMLPFSASAKEEGKEEAFVPQRIFIVSEENPDGTDLAQKVSFIGAEFEAKGICDSMQIVYGEASQAQSGDLLVQVTGASGEDSFEIVSGEGKVSVIAESPVSAMYGLRNILKSLMLGREVTDASETPDVTQRIFHLDCGRKYFSKEWIISLIKELSWLQMNQLEVDFSNGTGFRFALNDMTLDIDGDGVSDEDLSVLPGGVTDPDSWLGESDMDEIIATAGEYGVEIVPCLDTPGHTGWICGKEPFQKYSSNGELNVENEEATAFMKALVKKYAAYFVSRGCTTFHVGGDEFLHGAYNWGTPVASTEGKYGAVADYLDSLAGELKQIGIKKVRSFNDPLYYNGDLTTHTWQNIDEAEYWCYNGMNSFRYASPGLLAEQGFGMINGHGDFYDILTGGDDNWKKPVGDAGTKKTPAGIYAQFQNNTFAGNQNVEDSHVVGSTYFLWCDDPTQGTEQEVAVSLYTRLRSSSEKMKNEAASGSYEEFAATFTESAGGFTPGGTLQEPVVPKTEKIVSAGDLLKAKEAEDKIHAIGTVADLQKDKAAVEAARNAYNILTPEQKQMVSRELLAVLEEAERALARLEEQNKPGLPDDKKQDDGIKEGSTWEINNFRYKVTSVTAGTVALTGMKKPKASVNIKATVKIGEKQFQITEIAAKAFQKNSRLKKVTIGKNVGRIGKKAFFQCKKLKTIQINSKKLTAKTVGAKAFAKTFAKAKVKAPKAKRAAYKKFLYKKGLSKNAKIK